MSPEIWRRTIESPDFSQTYIVNGDRILEKDDGGYFPWWLNDLVTAMVDPPPMLEALSRSNAAVPISRGLGKTSACADLRSSIDRGMFCFELSSGLLISAFTTGFDAEFENFQSFGGKLSARAVVIAPEPGTTIRARITQLTELSEPDEDLFAISMPTPLRQRIGRMRVHQEELSSSWISGTAIEWPRVAEGLTKGRCSVYVSVDTSGQVREAWPAGCDNSGLQDPLRETVLKWRLRPATQNEMPMQVEALLTFTFATDVDSSKTPPVLSDSEARQLATDIVEPVFPPGSVERGAKITVRISVDETGKLTGVHNPDNLATPLFMAAYNALMKWKFRPYLQDGKPRYFHAILVFRPH